VFSANMQRSVGNNNTKLNDIQAIHGNGEDKFE
jgi:hypothetical protein